MISRLSCCFRAIELVLRPEIRGPTITPRSPSARPSPFETGAVPGAIPARSAGLRII